MLTIPRTDPITPPPSRKLNLRGFISSRPSKCESQVSARSRSGQRTAPPATGRRGSAVARAFVITNQRKTM